MVRKAVTSLKRGGGLFAGSNFTLSLGKKAPSFACRLPLFENFEMESQSIHGEEGRGGGTIRLLNTLRDSGPFTYFKKRVLAPDLPLAVEGERKSGGGGGGEGKETKFGRAQNSPRKGESGRKRKL